MRDAKSHKLARSFLRRDSCEEPRLLQLAEGTAVDLDRPCTVLGGRNGAGKSRLLRAAYEHLPDEAILVDLHWLAQQSLSILRARTDVEDLLEDYGPHVLSGEPLDDVSRIVGRDYDSVEWYSTDLQPDENEVAAEFLWGGDEVSVPHFRVSYRGRTYSSTEMGLGEYSAHLLFWILEQHREATGRLLLLDEPDAFLPPVGIAVMLGRLARICQSRQWRMMMTSHSEELVRMAVEESAFVLVEPTGADLPLVSHSKGDYSVADGILSPVPVDTVVFCEDETAYYLIRAMLHSRNSSMFARTQIVWGGGHGYLTGLRGHVPVARGRIRYAFVYDGDQREPGPPDKAWPAVFLPTANDPDMLLTEAGEHPQALAESLGEEVGRIRRVLVGLEGKDPHDWVNGMGEAFDRPRALGSLAKLWVDGHTDETREFVEMLEDAVGVSS